MKFLGIALALLVLSVAHADESVNNYIRAILQNLKGQMTTGIPDMKVPVLDPLNIPTINEHIKEGVADVKILVDKLNIEGLSKFETQMVDANIQDLRLSLSLFIPRVSGKAYYDLDGKIFNIIPLYGKGDANVQVVDLTAIGSAALSITADGHLKMNDFSLDIGFGSVFVNLQNILGGGNLGQVVNGVINVIGKSLFDKFKPDIKREMSKAILGEINKALSKVKLSDIQGGLIPSGFALSDEAVSYEAGNANAFLDNLLTNARPTIEKELDPVDLPHGEVGFAKKIIGITFHGHAKVYQGWLAGLRTLHRTGDAEMTNTPDGAIVVDAKLGLNNLQGHYRASAKFMNLGPETGVTLTVTAISVRIKVKQGFVPGAHPELLAFAVEKVDAVNVKLDTGLGPLDWILSGVVNLVSNLVKDLVVKIVNAPLHKILADTLGKITIPIGK